MDDDTKTAFNHVFRCLADHAEALFELQKTMTATFQTMKLVPGFAHSAYSNNFDEVSAQLSDSHVAVMQKLESLAKLFE